MLTTLWQALFSSIHNFLGPVGTSGPTSQRPVNSSQNPLYIGQSFFDTTLGLPIWVKSLNPTVWTTAFTPASAGSEQTLFYTLGYAPATSQASDVTLTPVLSSMPNRYLLTSIVLLLSSAATSPGGSQVFEVWTGAGKTGIRLDGGGSSMGTVSPLTQWQWQELGGPLVAFIASTNQQGVSSNVNTAFASMSAGGVTGTTTWDIYVQGRILPFGP